MAERTTPEAPILGLHHLSLTVSDVDGSVPWYVGVLGFTLVGEHTHDEGRTVELAAPQGELALLLQQHKAHEGAGFSEFRPGLDHLSLRVADVAALHAWADRFDDLGVEHGGVRSEPTGSALVARDPDRIQVELFADPA